MTKEGLLRLEDVLVGIRQTYKDKKVVNAKFFYAVKRNLDLIKEQSTAIRMELIKSYQAAKGDEKDNEYEKKRIALCEEFSNKNEEGKPVIKPTGHFDIPQEKAEEFQTKFAELNKEYQDVLDKRTKDAEAINKMLSEAIDVNLFKIHSDILPNNEGVLTPEEIDYLMPMIED
jgi:hypothetical protein